MIHDREAWIAEQEAAYLDGGLTASGRREYEEWLLADDRRRRRLIDAVEIEEEMRGGALERSQPGLGQRKAPGRHYFTGWIVLGLLSLAAILALVAKL